jgi:hypothetical protein
MRKCLAVLAASFVAFVSADTASAIPAFGQRYKVDCHMCHQGFPKLNKTGQAFKERGFRLENEDPFKVQDWVDSIPVRVRASANHYFFEGGDSFNYGYIKAVSAGNLGSRLSYWGDVALLLDDDKNNDVVQEPDNLWARVEVVKGGKLYVRGGRMELDLPFTQARTPNLFSYGIYFANTGVENDSIASYQHGLELGGSLSEDTIHWSAAVVGGAEDDAGKALDSDAGKFEGNVFLRVARRGDNHRFGAFSYVGRNTLAAPRTGGGAALTWKDNLLRVGADADLWFSKLNVYGAYLYGRNSDSQRGGGGPSANFHGGFVQADYHAVEKEVSGFLKEIAVAFTLRANRESRPTNVLTLKETFSGFNPGVRVHLRERFRMVFEYGFQGQKRADQGAVQAELVF